MMLGGTQEMFWMSWRRGKIDTLPLPGIERFTFQPIAYGHSGYALAAPIQCIIKW